MSQSLLPLSLLSGLDSSQHAISLRPGVHLVRMSANERPEMGLRRIQDKLNISSAISESLLSGQWKIFSSLPTQMETPYNRKDAMPTIPPMRIHEAQEIKAGSHTVASFLKLESTLLALARNDIPTSCTNCKLEWTPCSSREHATRLATASLRDKLVGLGAVLTSEEVRTGVTSGQRLWFRGQEFDPDEPDEAEELHAQVATLPPGECLIIRALDRGRFSNSQIAAITSDAELTAERSHLASYPIKDGARPSIFVWGTTCPRCQHRIVQDRNVPSTSLDLRTKESEQTPDEVWDRLPLSGLQSSVPKLSLRELCTTPLLKHDTLLSKPPLKELVRGLSLTSSRTLKQISLLTPLKDLSAADRSCLLLIRVMLHAQEGVIDLLDCLPMPLEVQARLLMEMRAETHCSVVLTSSSDEIVATSSALQIHKSPTWLKRNHPYEEQPLPPDRVVVKGSEVSTALSTKIPECNEHPSVALDNWLLPSPRKTVMAALGIPQLLAPAYATLPEAKLHGITVAKLRKMIVEKHSELQKEVLDKLVWSGVQVTEVADLTLKQSSVFWSVLKFPERWHTALVDTPLWATTLGTPLHLLDRERLQFLRAFIGLKNSSAAHTGLVTNCSWSLDRESRLKVSRFLKAAGGVEDREVLFLFDYDY